MDLETLTKALEDAEAKIDAVEKRAAEAEAALAEREAEIEKMKGPPAEEDVLKGVPETIRKRLAEAEEGVRKLNEERDTNQAIAKARGLGVAQPEKVGPLLLRLAKGQTTPEDATQVEQLLKAAATVEKHSALFKSLGSEQAAEADPEAVLKAKTEEVRKGNPALTEAQAYDLALQANPHLYVALAKRKNGHAAA